MSLFFCEFGCRRGEGQTLYIIPPPPSSLSLGITVTDWTWGRHAERPDDNLAALLVVHERPGSQGLQELSLVMGLADHEMKDAFPPGLGGERLVARICARLSGAISGHSPACCLRTKE